MGVEERAQSTGGNEKKQTVKKKTPFLGKGGGT